MEDDIKRILQDKQFHLQLKSEQKEILQNVLERKDSMAVLPTGFGKSMCYVPPPSHFGQGKIIICKSSPMIHCGNRSFHYGERSNVPRLQQVEQIAVREISD
jgi:ATP-dependent DNA helicase RecQ